VSVIIAITSFLVSGIESNKLVGTLEKI